MARAAERARGVPLRHYWCGACEGYHLTRRPTMLDMLHPAPPPPPAPSPNAERDRLRRRKQARRTLAKPNPLPLLDVQNLLTEIEALRSALFADQEATAGTPEGKDVAEVLSELKARRDALRFIIKRAC